MRDQKGALTETEIRNIMYENGRAVLGVTR
jgi:hypothetical protein